MVQLFHPLVAAAVTGRDGVWIIGDVAMTGGEVALSRGSSSALVIIIVINGATP